MTELRTGLRQEMAELCAELRRHMSDLRHTFEFELTSAVTQPRATCAHWSVGARGVSCRTRLLPGRQWGQALVSAADLREACEGVLSLDL